jgi:hypothetical protein
MEGIWKFKKSHNMGENNMTAGVPLVRHSKITLPSGSTSVNVLADSKKLGLKRCL